jgi:hypothetical protein
MDNVSIEYETKRFKSGGLLELAKLPNHGQNPHEVKNNLIACMFLAKKIGCRYRLLPVMNGSKSPDALNLHTGFLSDVKIPNTHNAKNAMQNSIHSASKQKSEEVIIFLKYDYDRRGLRRGLLNAFLPGRSETIKEVVIVFKDGEVKRYKADIIRAAIKKSSGRRP